MARVIVAVGGGKRTLLIDREIVRLANKKSPTLLLIPTASSDSEQYWSRAQQYYGKFLKCKTDVLFLIKEQPSSEQIEKKISSADIIYVPGGNTLLMMRVWRRLGVDRFLKRAYERGTVLAGMSAGAICWFDSGHSDSMSFYQPRKWEYINVRGLGILKGILCPHFNSMTLGIPRRSHFQDMILKTGGIGIAIENNCAIEFKDGQFYKVISSRSHANAYRVHKSLGKVVVERLPQTNRPVPVESLYCW
jgi:dipeptidase E